MSFLLSEEVSNKELKIKDNVNVEKNSRIIFCMIPVRFYNIWHLIIIYFDKKSNSKKIRFDSNYFE